MRNLFPFKSGRYKPCSASLLLLLTRTLFIVICSGGGGGSDRLRQVDATLMPTQINQNLTLTLDSSPYVAEHDVYVHRKAKLTIEPGVELRFGKGRQLHVHGTLDARGTENRRIRFTKLHNSFNSPLTNGINYNYGTGGSNDTRSGFFEQASSLYKSSNFRLVEGETITDGKLQIFFNSKWHYVCSTAYK
jgi:hypothetical protein